MLDIDEDLQPVRDELDADPDVRGYDAMSDATAADDINLKRVAMDAQSVPSFQIAPSIDLNEFLALTGAQRAWLALVLPAGSVTAIRKGEVKQGLLSLFPSGTQTQANLLALIGNGYQGARWEELEWSRAVTPSDIADARRLS